MARVRRRAAKSRLNYEIAGMAAIGIAVLLAVALTLAPAHAGSAGAFTARVLHWLFGSAAGLFPVLIALFGAIIFLEINLPRIIATFGVAAVGYFILIDASLAKRGGFVGWEIWRGLYALVGLTGARIVIGLLALLLAVWISDVSVKKIIGWLVMIFSKIRIPKVRLALPDGHETLRDAFALPAADPDERKKQHAIGVATSIVAVEPLLSQQPPVVVDYEDEEVLEDDAAEDEEEEEADEDPDIGEEDDDEELDDEDEEDDEDEDEDAPAGVEGEYEAPAVAGGPRNYKLPDLSLFDPPQAQVVDDFDAIGRARGYARLIRRRREGRAHRARPLGDALRTQARPRRKDFKDRKPRRRSGGASRNQRKCIEAPIPGNPRSARGSQQNRFDRVDSRFSKRCQRGQVPPLWKAPGKDVPGRAVFGDLSPMPAHANRWRYGFGQTGLLEFGHRVAAGQRDARSRADTDDRSEARRTGDAQW